MGMVKENLFDKESYEFLKNVKKDNFTEIVMTL